MITQSVNVTPVLPGITSQGNSTTTGTITWTAPVDPAGNIHSKSVVISGQWSMSGGGSKTLTIDGHDASSPFSITLSNSSATSAAVTFRGHKNNNGNALNWQNVTVTYTYEILEDFTVTASSNSSAVTVTPASQVVLELSSATVTLSSKDDCTVYDNEVDVTALLSGLTYTIASVTEDHEIVVVYSGSSGGGSLYLKVAGNWVEAQEVYKKVDGNWVLQESFDTLIESGKIYTLRN